MSEDDEDNDDVFYMTDRRRTYIDPHTNELLFMEWSTHDDGWMPAKSTMIAWQQGNLRIYYPRDIPYPTLITMPGAQRWEIMSDTEEEDVRGLMVHPWIPDGQTIEGILEEDIQTMEQTYQWLTTATSDTVAINETLESARVPTLLLNMEYTIIPIQTSTPHVPPPKTTLLPFPRHLVAAVLANAEREGATCPITMEPITKATAAVTSCGHIFQTEAITRWLTTHTTCPECREPTCIG